MKGMTLNWECERWHAKTSKYPCDARRETKPKECEDCSGAVELSTKSQPVPIPKAICKTDGCNGVVYTKNLCQKCYQREWHEDHQKKGAPCQDKGVYKRGDIYWLRYAGINGKIIRESTGSLDLDNAKRMLASRKTEIAEKRKPTQQKQPNTKQQEKVPMATKEKSPSSFTMEDIQRLIVVRQEQKAQIDEQIRALLIVEELFKKAN